MALPQQYKITSFKSACDRSQNWITKNMEKISNHTKKFQTFKNGYNKIRPRIFPKGLNSYQEQNIKDSDDDEDFMRNLRPRYHSIDVIDNKVRNAYKEQLSEVPEKDENNSRRASRENLLAGSIIELRIIDTVATPKKNDRWKIKNKQDKFIAKSVDDDSDLKVLPSVLLTYNPKFIKIDSSRRYSLNNSYSDSFHSLDSTA
ncbi:hypothetical protein PVAND_005354 [Polypedilum vanderplanki]|uniref:Uncharacterized protein n=1 Tax=Polypedilum vanderplanki TaxID=319348 RepID=A0A9J6C0B5_POLVA|nr:hypothetical protein PVAND_005354 [Polypedilum vanderplanki]